MRNEIDSYIDLDINNDILKFFKLDKIFGPYPNNMTLPFKDKNFDKNKIHFKALDDINEYSININGFRNTFDFDDSITTISAGCSVTFGMGVPDSGTWPMLLGSFLKEKVANLSSPGASIHTICNDVLKYCMQFKKPKNIYILFPSIFRKTLIDDRRYYSNMGTTWGTKENDSPLQPITIMPDIIFDEVKSKIMFFNSYEKDKNIENILSPHQYIFDSIISIFMLESFCKSNNINLQWSTWCGKSQHILNTILNIKNLSISQYKNISFVAGTNNLLNIKCKDHHNNKLYNNLSWNAGSDYVIETKTNTKQGISHPGIHFHYHVAEFFNNLLEKNKI